MQILIHFIGALLLAYFISRLTLRFKLAAHPLRALLASHAAALVVGLILLAALKAPYHAFGQIQFAQMALAQFVCLLLDLVRKNTPRVGAQ